MLKTNRCSALRCITSCPAIPLTSISAASKRDKAIRKVSGKEVLETEELKNGGNEERRRSTSTPCQPQCNGILEREDLARSTGIAEGQNSPEARQEVKRCLW